MSEYIEAACIHQRHVLPGAVRGEHEEAAVLAPRQEPGTPAMYSQISICLLVCLLVLLVSLSLSLI